jgi:hypothetical protein
MAVFGVASTLGRAIGLGVGLGGCLSAAHGGTGVLHVEGRRGGHLGEGRHGGWWGAMAHAQVIRAVGEGARLGRQKPNDLAVALGGREVLVLGISTPWPRVLAAMAIELSGRLGILLGVCERGSAR